MPCRSLFTSATSSSRDMPSRSASMGRAYLNWLAPSLTARSELSRFRGLLPAASASGIVVAQPASASAAASVDTLASNNPGMFLEIVIPTKTKRGHGSPQGASAERARFVFRRPQALIPGHWQRDSPPMISVRLQLALYSGGLQLPHRTSQGIDAEPGSAEKCTEKEIDERLVRLPCSTARRAGDRRGEVSPHPAARARIEHHRLGMKAGPSQNERTLINAARQTNRRRRHRRRLRLPAENLNGGAGGIGDDPDLLVTPVVHGRTALRE